MFNPRPILIPLTRKGSGDTRLNENSLTQEESMIVVWSSFHMTMLVTKTLNIDSPTNHLCMVASQMALLFRH